MWSFRAIWNSCGHVIYFPPRSILAQILQDLISWDWVHCFPWRLGMEMKPSSSLAGGMLTLHLNNGGNWLLLWSNASRGSELAVGHVVLWRSACSLSAHACWVRGRMVSTVLAICVALVVELAANTCLSLPPRMCLTSLPLPEVCSEMLSSKCSGRLLFWMSESSEVFLTHCSMVRL